MTFWQHLEGSLDLQADILSLVGDFLVKVGDIGGPLELGYEGWIQLSLGYKGPVYALKEWVSPYDFKVGLVASQTCLHIQL